MVLLWTPQDFPTEKQNPNPEATLKSLRLAVFGPVLPRGYLNTLCIEVALKDLACAGGYQPMLGSGCLSLSQGLTPPPPPPTTLSFPDAGVLVNAACHLVSQILLGSASFSVNASNTLGTSDAQALGVTMSRLSVHSSLTPRFTCLLRRHHLANSDFFVSFHACFGNVLSEGFLSNASSVQQLKV